MSYGKNFVVEDSDESDYENRITRKPRNLKTNTEVVRTSQERRKYNENDDDDDDDSEDDRRQIKSRSNTRGRRNTDNNEIDENDQRYTKRESVRRSGDAFVPKSLDREYDRGGGDGGTGVGGRIQTAGRPQRPPPATAWVSGKRDERTEPENYRNEPVRSWAKATPKGETRDIRESNERRSISRHSSDEEEDNNIPRSNRNRSPADRNGPVRQPPRGERIPNRYTRDGYDEEEPSYNNQRGDRDRDRDRDRERDQGRDRDRDRERERGDSRSRSRSGSNSQRYPPNSRNRYGNYEEEDNENEHEHEEEEIPRNRLANRQNYIQDLSYGAVVQRSDRELDLTRGSSGTVEDDLLSDDGNGADIIKQEHDLNERNANDLGGVMRLGANSSFVFLCPANGGATELVQCVIIRDRENLGGSIYPSYKLYLEKNMKLLIIAQKMNLNTTSNYHLFDMTRGAPSGNLSKKSGNYLGKLRAHDTQRTEYALVTRSEEREEVGAIIFERIGIFSQLKEGCQPRKMTVLLPNLNAESEPIPHKVSKKSGQKKSLVDMLKNSETGRMFLLKSKEPVYENGNYRLNFHGRVSVPSVKNFQLSSPDDPAHVVCQFGKVGEERFHLDYKAPLNAFQAFSLALCHFDT